MFGGDRHWLRSVSAAIFQDNSLLESVFVIAVKVWPTLILVSLIYFYFFIAVV